ncbi:hypothetical protein GOV05_04675 [Candidatus Woesearchaeota archaeon]|nr:hypothetical protein [Candidatus Woesearchaeota archaeon]
MNRKKRLENAKKADFSSRISSKEQQKFLEFLKYQSLYEKISEKQEVSASELIKKIEGDILVPTSIFNKELGALETICKYLKENLNLPNKKISSLIGRDSKSVWQAINKAKAKLPKKFVVLESKYFVPVSILKNKELSVLENMVLYFVEDLGLSLIDISKILVRDERTIWTVHKRVKVKHAKKK